MALPAPSDLPVFPRPAALARLLVVYPDAKIDDYARIVGSDPALAAQLLRLANSAANRGIAPVTSVQGAVVRLGVDATRRTVSLMVVRSTFGGLEQAGLSTQDLWWHVLGTGLLAEALCAKPELGQTAFVAGLLHDLGRLSLAAMSPLRYARVAEQVRSGGEVLRAERAEFGVTHISWGAQIAEYWRLPPLLIEAIAGHHEGATGVAELVLRSRQVLEGLGFGDGLRPGVTGRMSDEVTAILPLVESSTDASGITMRLEEFSANAA